MLITILILELIALYFLSRWVTQALYRLLLFIFRARSVAVSLLLVLEFPGTVIHELSHLFTAEILGVRTGRMRLEPESIRGPDITSGSVMIAETDPFRHAMIGLAPISWGMVTLTAISFFLNQGNMGYWGYWGLGYLLFAVSNTMFPSPVDMKGVWPFAVASGIFFGGAYFLGLQIALTGQALDVAVRILTTLTQSLGIVVGINSVLLIITGLILRMFSTR
jgi:hypothetical protein